MGDFLRTEKTNKTLQLRRIFFSHLPEGLSPLKGVMSHHRHWYRCPFSDTATSSLCSTAILAKRTDDPEAAFSGQNSSSSPSQRGLLLSGSEEESLFLASSPSFPPPPPPSVQDPGSRRADSSHRFGP